MILEHYLPLLIITATLAMMIYAYKILFPLKKNSSHSQAQIDALKKRLDDLTALIIKINEELSKKQNKS